MRRILTGGLALWLVAAGLLAVAPAVAAAQPGHRCTPLSGQGKALPGRLVSARGSC